MCLARTLPSMKNVKPSRSSTNSSPVSIHEAKVEAPQELGDEWHPHQPLDQHAQDELRTMQRHPPAVGRRREGRGEDERGLAAVAARIQSRPDRVELFGVVGVGVLEVRLLSGRDEVCGEVGEGVELADDRPHPDLAVRRADREHAIRDRHDGAEVAEPADDTAEGALLSRPGRGRGVPSGRGAVEQLSLRGQQVEALDPLAFLAVGGREAGEAIAGERAARGGVFRGHSHRGHQPEGLELGTDRAPGRPGADSNPLVRQHLDRVEAQHRDDQIFAEGLPIE